MYHFQYADPPIVAKASEEWIDFCYSKELLLPKIQISCGNEWPWDMDIQQVVQVIEDAKKCHLMIARPDVKAASAPFLANWICRSFTNRFNNYSGSMPLFLHIYLRDQYRQMVELFWQRFPAYDTDPDENQDLQFSLRRIAFHTD